MPKRNKGITALAGEVWRRLRATLRSSRGKDVLLFLLFVCVSYVFWLIQTLNDDAQKEVQIPLRIEAVPDDVTFISDVPPTLMVSVRDRGTSLFRYAWSGAPTLGIPFGDMSLEENAARVSLSDQELSSRVRSLFGQQAQVLNVRPDSLSLIFTDRPGRRVKIKPDVDARPSWQSVISGRITVEPDSVTVYSVPRLVSNYTSLSTYSLALEDLSETYTGEVKVKAPVGTRAVPDVVKVTVPVEPLISKTRTVAVNLKNAPAEGSVVMFPSRVDVTFLVPMSRYNAEVGNITVYADFSRRTSRSAKMPVYLGSVPDGCRDVSLAIDSVEYLIEQSR